MGRGSSGLRIIGASRQKYSNAPARTGASSTGRHGRSGQQCLCHRRVCGRPGVARIWFTARSRDAVELAEECRDGRLCSALLFFVWWRQRGHTRGRGMEGMAAATGAAHQAAVGRRCLARMRHTPHARAAPCPGSGASDCNWVLGSLRRIGYDVSGRTLEHDHSGGARTGAGAWSAVDEEFRAADRHRIGRVPLIRHCVMDQLGVVRRQQCRRHFGVDGPWAHPGRALQRRSGSVYAHRDRLLGKNLH
mmetsp:Transcript_9014/g.27945  ORF Transcript_9014/g.27945 Transcript_9014/m.27945 type:complete len:248 (-) Transcript_9014:987-1730(-)